MTAVPLPRTSERSRSCRRVDRIGYDLAYFNLWWSRMAIEGRKEAKETLRKEQEQAKTRRRLVKGRKRMTRGVEAVGDSFLVPASVSQMTEDLRGGTNLERGNFNVGVERGSPVPSNLRIKEQPLVQTKKTLILDTVAEEGRDNLENF